MRDESWTDDGRRGDSGQVDDKDWMARDERFDASVDELEKRGLAIEACVEAAAGEEPEVLWDDISPDPYEAIGAEAEAMAALRELEAADCEALMQTSFGAYIDADVIGGELNPAVWAAAEAHALPTLYAIGGEELLSEANVVVAPAPSPADAATARQLIEDSSADACEDTTWVFQINIAGLGLAIGTPFDDVIRGNDDESGFEVLVGARGDDCINGRKGHELILGGRDNDELHGGDQHELIFGGPGDDELYLGEGADYDITLPTTPPMVLNIDIGSVAFGGKGADFISGGDPTFDLTAEDTLGFTDIIFGDGVSASGSGPDVIEGAGGVDLLFGQWGDDEVANHRAGLLELHIPATGEIEETDIDLEFGSLLFGGKGNDQLGGSPSFDLLFGNTGNDVGLAGAGLDLVFGGNDNDTMDGEDGLDLVFGSKGDDTLSGGEGIDLVFGGLGDDIIAGGAGGHRPALRRQRQRRAQRRGRH
jgi:Ca2+-binding RTX toxin-like protein